MFSIMFVLVMLSLLNFVFAASNSANVVNDITDLLDNGVAVIEPIAKQVLGETSGIGDYGSGEMLFAKILFFIIILSIIWVALERIDFFGDNLYILWILSISVAILATRFISTSLVPTILLPYQTLGIAIAAGLPFVIWFILIEVGMQNSGKTMRKIAWIFFAVIFIGLWIARYEELGNGRWIYLATAIVALLMLWMDGTIQTILKKMKVDRARASKNGELIAISLEKIQDAENHLSNNRMSRSDADKIIAREKKNIARWSKA